MDKSSINRSKKMETFYDRLEWQNIIHAANYKIIRTGQSTNSSNGKSNDHLSLLDMDLNSVSVKTLMMIEENIKIDVYMLICIYLWIYSGKPSNVRLMCTD